MTEEEKEKPQDAREEAENENPELEEAENENPELEEAENENPEEEEEEENVGLVKLDEDELEELDEDELEEDDEIDEIDEVEAEPDIGAIQVIGQGDFSMCQANRGADDPGDNTLMEPQWMTKFGEMFFVTDRGNHRVLIWDQIPEEDGEPASVVLGQEDFADCLENRGITTTLDEMTSGLGDESLDGFTISKAQDDTLSQVSECPLMQTNTDGKLLRRTPAAPSLRIAPPPAGSPHWACRATGSAG